METTTEVTGGKRLLAATEIPNPSDFQSRRKFVAAVATLSLAACGGGSKSDPGVADPVPMGPISRPLRSVERPQHQRRSQRRGRPVRAIAQRELSGFSAPTRLPLQQICHHRRS